MKTTWASKACPVVAYRAHLPLRVVAQGISDDRGVYRIKGLDTGKYWIRSTAHTARRWQRGCCPLSVRNHAKVREARAHDVHLDDDTPDADVHPEFGHLFQHQRRPAVHRRQGQGDLDLGNRTPHY